MLMTDQLPLKDDVLPPEAPAGPHDIFRVLGISIYTTNSASEENGLCLAKHYYFLTQKMAYQLGGPVEVRVEVGQPLLWYV